MRRTIASPPNRPPKPSGRPTRGRTYRTGPGRTPLPGQARPSGRHEGEQRQAAEALDPENSRLEGGWPKASTLGLQNKFEDKTLDSIERSSEASGEDRTTVADHTTHRAHQLIDETGHLPVRRDRATLFSGHRQTPREGRHAAEQPDRAVESSLRRRHAAHRSTACRTTPTSSAPTPAATEPFTRERIRACGARAGDSLLQDSPAQRMHGAMGPLAARTGSALSE